MVATTLVGLGFFPTSAYSSVQSYIGRTTIAGGWQYGAGFVVTDAGNGRVQINPYNGGTYGDEIYNGEQIIAAYSYTTGGRVDWSDPRQSWNPKITANGDSWEHPWGTMVKFGPPPAPVEKTLTQSISVDGTTTLLSTTTHPVNSSVNISIPFQTYSQFLYWTKDGTSQSTPLPSDITISEDTAIVFHFDQDPSASINITLPPDSFSSRALTITGSDQGAIVTGNIILPGATYSNNFFVRPGETITIIVDGQTIDQFTFPLENPADYSFSTTLPAVPQPTPTPTPSPTPTPIPSIFPTNSIAPPPVNPPPPPLGGGGGDTGGGTIFNGVTNTPSPLPSPPQTTNPNLPNPYGNFSLTNAQIAVTDFYEVIKKAIVDASTENAPGEQQTTDTSGIDILQLERKNIVNNSMNHVATNIYAIGENIQDIIQSFSDLLNVLNKSLPDPTTNPSVNVSIPTIGSFTISLNALPGRDLLRAIFTFFIYLRGFIIAIHIIRKGIS